MSVLGDGGSLGFTAFYLDQLFYRDVLCYVGQDTGVTGSDQVFFAALKKPLFVGLVLYKVWVEYTVKKMGVLLFALLYKSWLINKTANGHGTPGF